MFPPLKKKPRFSLNQLCTLPSWWLEWWMFVETPPSPTFHGKKNIWLSGMGLGSGNFRCGSWHLVHRGWYDLLSQADQITMSGRGFLLVGGFNSSKSQRSYVSTRNKKVSWSQQNCIGDRNVRPSSKLHLKQTPRYVRGFNHGKLPLQCHVLQVKLY